MVSQVPLFHQSHHWFMATRWVTGLGSLTHKGSPQASVEGSSVYYGRFFFFFPQAWDMTHPVWTHEIHKKVEFWLCMFWWGMKIILILYTSRSFCEHSSSVEMFIWQVASEVSRLGLEWFEYYPRERVFSSKLPWDNWVRNYREREGRGQLSRNLNNYLGRDLFFTAPQRRLACIQLLNNMMFLKRQMNAWVNESIFKSLWNFE